MKKKLTRMLAVLLIAMMLIPTLAALATSAHAATGSSQLQNMYNTATEITNGVPDPSSYGKSVSAPGHRGSAPIDVTPGDVIYFGPCDPSQQWHLALYSAKTGTQTANRKSVANFTKIATLDNTAVFYSFVIPSGVCAFAYAHKIANCNYPTLITINQPFGLTEYDNFMNGGTNQGPSISESSTQGFEGLWNYFPQDEGFERNEMLRQHGNNNFVTSPYIPVTAGDVLHIGALSLDDYLKKPTKDLEHHVLTLFDASYKILSTLYLDKLQLVESIGYGYGIYKYTIPETVSKSTVAFAKIDVHEGIYNDGDMFVTKNQPFTGEQLRKELGIAEPSATVKEHPFYGKKALFIGDSISYGSYDTPPTYSNPSASWARRLALTTGLIPTNVSYPGASVAKTGISGVKWEYELISPEIISRRTYDMIVFHGGVNDARQGVEAGVAMSSDTPRRDLNDEERLATFAGGLQWMFHETRTRWPEAELYYVANFKLVPDSLKGKDMNEYLTQAKILCAEYGVHYIDLFDDAVLYETFDYTSKDFLSDLIHPSGPAYDVLFPSILRLFEATIPEPEPDGPAQPDPEQTTPEETTPATPEQTTPEQTTPNTPDNGDVNQGTQKLGIGAIIGIIVAGTVLAAGAVVGFIFLKKKKIGK